MTTADIIPAISPVCIQGNTDTEINSLTYDSQDVKPGAVFFAFKGIHTDGHRYIDNAIKAGAIAIVHSEPVEERTEGVAWIQVPDTRIALSRAAAAYWKHPSRSLTVIGVTGTDGKSTTVSLVRQLLLQTGASVGSLSTVEYAIAENCKPNPLRQSTPEANHIHQLLAAMRDAGHEYAVLETTSHGLSPRTSRLADVLFDAAVFTNVTSEHLEFHGNLETYRADKARLFSSIANSPNPEAFGVVNADDPFAHLFIAAAGQRPVLTYSLHHDNGDLFAADCMPDPAGTTFVLNHKKNSVQTRINMPGLFNLENTLAALSVTARLRNMDPLELAAACPGLTGIKGRMEAISGNMDFHVIVDYAHSPGSFEKVLPYLKGLVKNRLILVFGSAGERDAAKRPVQGRIAAEHADVIFLTDEDPRGEDPMAIIKDIAGGISSKMEGENLFLIPDRREAVRQAFHIAQPGDLVATLGKGHEQSIIYADGPKPWDEAQVCREVLKEMETRR